MLTTIKYKKELENYNNQPVVYITAEYYAATLPYEFVRTKQILTEDNKSIDIPKFINNLILLNPQSDLSTIINLTNLKITKLYQQPLNYIVLVDMCEKLYNNKHNLIPQDVKIKEKWINPTIENKKKFYEETMKNETITKIDNYFNDLINYSTTKITKESISSEIGIGVASMYRHITDEQKQMIKDHNLKIKQSKEIKLNLNDCDFLFVNKPAHKEEIVDLFTTDIPTQIEELEVKPACPIKVKTIEIIRENLNELFEQYILTNNNNKYEFSDETFTSIINHFSQVEIEWLKTNLMQCTELKKKQKLFERAKRELLYIRFTEGELTVDNTIEYTPIGYHIMPQIKSPIEEVEYEDDVDEDEEDVQCKITEYC